MPDFGRVARFLGLDQVAQQTLLAGYQASLDLFFWSGVMQGFLAGFLTCGLSALILSSRSRRRA